MTTPEDPDQRKNPDPNYYAKRLFNESEEKKQSENYQTYERCRVILEVQYDSERLNDRLFRLIVKMFYGDIPNIRNASKIVRNLPIPQAIATNEKWLNAYHDGKIDSDDYSNKCFTWAIGLVNQNKTTFDTCVNAFTQYDKDHFEEVVTALIDINELDYYLRRTLPHRKRVSKTIEEANRHEKEDKEEKVRIKDKINRLTARLNELHM